MKKIIFLSILPILIACDPVSKKIEEEPKMTFNNLTVSSLSTSDIYNYYLGSLQKDTTIKVFIVPGVSDKIEVYLTTESNEDNLITNHFEVLNHGSFKIGKADIYNGSFYDSISKNTLTFQNFSFP